MTDIEYSFLDINDLKDKIPTFDSQKLCEMIICHRYLGFNKDISLLCMNELSIRREAGDPFLFEDYISKSEKELPKLDFSLPDLREILSQLKK